MTRASRLPSAIENRRIALPGHKFKVIALDGNSVPSPQPVEALFLGAGERIFDGSVAQHFEPLEAVHSPLTTHIRYRLTR